MAGRNATPATIIAPTEITFGGTMTSSGDAEWDLLVALHQILIRWQDVSGEAKLRVLDTLESRLTQDVIEEQLREEPEP